MASTTLTQAKVNKNDEFYTRREDIERELRHYAEHFRGKVVYCNCDDPKDSEFVQFFCRNFRAWGLKRLIATHYDPDERNYSYSITLEGDTDGDGLITVDDMTQTPILSNGDFRSAACIELLKQADIVVTNPPFSLFREYVLQLVEHGKKFLIIGNQNVITYKEIFPLIKDNKMWMGYHCGDMAFKVPPYYEPKATRYWVDETGQKWRSMGNACWFTNLDIPKRHQPLDLRGNYFKENEDKFPVYVNCDAIEVAKVAEIPCDYDGIMGVPVTFIDKYCPEQFEILGLDYDKTIPTNTGLDEAFVKEYYEQGNTGSICVGHPSLGYRQKDGKVIRTYRRILIRKLKG